MVWLIALWVALLLLWIGVGHALYGGEPQLAPVRATASMLVTPTPPPPGTILATRNDGGRETNPTPRFWNHLAIMGPNGWVVEAQDKYGVGAVPFHVFYRRYCAIMACQLVPPEKGRHLALAASAQLGQPYDRRKNNCVDLVKTAVRCVMDKEPRGLTPTAIVNGCTRKLWEKSQHPWIRSTEPFAEWTDDPAMLARPYYDRLRF